MKTSNTIKTFKRLALTLFSLTLGGAASVQAATWQATYEQAIWQASEPSPLNCQLTHAIPNFGLAIFNHRAGEDVKLSIKPFRQAFNEGPVRLVALAPQWQPGLNTQQLGSYTYNADQQTLELNTQITQEFLTSLYEGLMPSMLQEAKASTTANLKKASLTPVNFHQAFAQFQVCQASLLPENYDQLKNRTIYFALGGNSLSAADKRLLDRLVHYSFADDEVIQINLDGHSDSLGTRRDNRQLSSQRANVVTDYLISRGVSEDKIQTQYHGQRYPIASNATPAGRSKNRRVEIKLVKKREIDPLY